MLERREIGWRLGEGIWRRRVAKGCADTLDNLPHSGVPQPNPSWPGPMMDPASAAVRECVEMEAGGGSYTPSGRIHCREFLRYCRQQCRTIAQYTYRTNESYRVMVER